VEAEGSDDPPVDPPVDPTVDDPDTGKGTRKALVEREKGFK
jgi:hypothetical protein